MSPITPLPCFLLLATAASSLTAHATIASQASTAPAVTEQAAIEHISVRHKQAYRGDVPLKLQPQAMETLSLELLTDNGISSFQQALDLSGSIARQNNGGGLWDSFSIRGFSGNRDLSNIEYIEIMKGPGSALFGVNTLSLIWLISIVLAVVLYWPTKWFSQYKHSSKKPWLRYL